MKGSDAMKRILMLFIASYLLILQIGCSSVKAAYNIFSNGITVTLDDGASIQIPNTLEIQSEDYRAFVRRYGGPAPSLGGNKVICQSRGLNADMLSGRRHPYYVRVILEHIRYEETEENYKRGLSYYTQSDLKQLTDGYAQEMNRNKMGNRYFDFETAYISKISDGECIILKYKRQLNNNPVVQCIMYMMPYKDRMYALTVGYRISEFNLWCSQYEDIRDVIYTFATRN